MMQEMPPVGAGGAPAPMPMQQPQQPQIPPEMQQKAAALAALPPKDAITLVQLYIQQAGSPQEAQLWQQLGQQLAQALQVQGGGAGGGQPAAAPAPTQPNFIQRTLG